MKVKIAEIAVKAGGVTAGAVLAKFADRLVPNLNPMIKGGAKIAIGAIVPAFMPKNKFVDNMGSGMIAVGAVELATELVPGVISGANENPIAGIGAGEGITIDEDYEMSGTDDDDDGIDGANDNPMAGVSDDDFDEESY